MHDARVFLKWTAIQMFFISSNIPRAPRCCCWVCGTANATRSQNLSPAQETQPKLLDPRFDQPLKKGAPAKPGRLLTFPVILFRNSVPSANSVVIFRYFLSASSFNEAELMQYRSPVG